MNGLKLIWPSSTQSGLKALTLGAGTYRVTLTSFDDTHPVTDDLPGERWYLQLLDANGNVVTSSNSISDLAGDQQWLTEGVGTVTVPAGTTVTHLRAVMPAAADGSSIHSIEACLEAV